MCVCVYVCVCVCVCAGGFYVSTASVLVWLSWIKYISFIFWGYTALIVNEFATGESVETLRAMDGVCGEVGQFGGWMG